MKAKDLFFDMMSKFYQKFHSYYHKIGGGAVSWPFLGLQGPVFPRYPKVRWLTGFLIRKVVNFGPEYGLFKSPILEGKVYFGHFWAYRAHFFPDHPASTF